MHKLYDKVQTQCRLKAIKTCFPEICFFDQLQLRISL